MKRHPCACKAKGCKCGANVVIRGEACRYCRAGHSGSSRRGLQIRFTPHVNHSLTAAEAKRHGLKRTSDGGTWIPTEKKLNEYLTEEKRRGREVLWREH